MDSDLLLNARSITFSELINRTCINVTGAIDEQIEDIEQFTLMLSSTDPVVEISVPTLLLTITDLSTGERVHYRPTCTNVSVKMRTDSIVCLSVCLCLCLPVCLFSSHHHFKLFFLDLAEAGFTGNTTSRLELTGVVSVCLELLVPVERLERNVTVQLDTQDETATSKYMLLLRRTQTVQREYTL